jgi:hypothetical protein
MLPEFDRTRNCITPRLSVVAAPATTISVPKTFFTRTNWGTRQLSAGHFGDDASSKTTILSCGSVSEITWEEDVPCDIHKPLFSKSSARLSDSSSSHKRSQGWPTYTSNRYPSIFASEHAAAEYVSSPLEPLTSHQLFSRGMSRSTDEESNITSFPELRPRHCTNEWLNPPAEIEQLVRASTSSLYHQGVDAHSGRAFALRDDVREASQPVIVASNPSLFHLDPFCNMSLHPHERRVTNGSSSTGNVRLGSSIASSYHQRHCAQVFRSNVSGWKSQDSRMPPILGQPRRHTQQDVNQQGCPPLHQNIWSSELKTSLATQAASVANKWPRGKSPNERPMKPQRAESLGVYDGRILLGGKMNTCSEDNLPHVCENDLEHCKGRRAKSPT